MSYYFSNITTTNHGKNTNFDSLIATLEKNIGKERRKLYYKPQ